MASAALVQGTDPLSNDGVLPADVLYEILLRVPAKELCRLRLVCRSWRSLTSDRSFARAHTARHPLFVALFSNRGQEIHLYSGDIVNRVRGLGDLEIRRLSVEVGLACVEATTVSDDDDVDTQDLVLNPATGAVTTLPDGNRPPLVSTCVLGHVPSMGEYKVLRLSHYVTARETMPIGVACEVIALGGSDQTWRAKPSPVDILGRSCDIAIVHGVAYFRAFDDDDSDMVPNVALFDLATEEWRPNTVRGPMSIHLCEEADHIQFASLDGCLVVIHHKNRDCSTDLWFLMDVDNAFWTKRYSMRCASHWCHAAFYPPRPLDILDDGRILAWLERQYVLSLYDPRTEAWADLATLEYYYAIGMHKVFCVHISRAEPCPFLWQTTNRFVFDYSITWYFSRHCTEIC